MSEFIETAYKTGVPVNEIQATLVTAMLESNEWFAVTWKSFDKYMEDSRKSIALPKININETIVASSEISGVDSLLALIKFVQTRSQKKTAIVIPSSFSENIIKCSLFQWNGIMFLVVKSKYNSVEYTVYATTDDGTEDFQSV